MKKQPMSREQLEKVAQDHKKSLAPWMQHIKKCMLNQDICTVSVTSLHLCIVCWVSILRFAFLTQSSSLKHL